MAYKGALLEYQHDKHLKWKNFTVSDFVLTLLLWDFLTISNLQCGFVCLFVCFPEVVVGWFGLGFFRGWVLFVYWGEKGWRGSSPPVQSTLICLFSLWGLTVTSGSGYGCLSVRRSCFLSLYHCLRPACVIAALSWLFYWIQHRQIVEAIFSYGDLYNLYSSKKRLHKLQIQNY